MKRRAERQELEADQVAGWRARLTAAIAAVEGAAETSLLPVEPSEAAVDAVDAWLRDVRKRSW